MKTFILPLAFLITFLGCFALFSNQPTQAAFNEGITALSSTELSDKNFSDVLIDALKWILSILAVIAVIALVGSGIMYITSGGDTNRAETAKQWMTYTIIGLVIALLGLVIVITIDAIINDNWFSWF
jgi:hypothetical protein